MISNKLRVRRGGPRGPWAVGASAALIVWAGAFATRSAPLQAAPAQQAVAASAVADQRAVFTRYCLGCHNQRLKERGVVPLALDTLDIANVGADAAAWEKVVLKIRAGVMPPSGAPRPDKATHERFAAWLETALDGVSAAAPNPGRTEPFHRLNRTEYQNAVRDLLALDVDVSSLLPADDTSYGFDNIAGVLKLSPTLMERYLTAAQKVSRLAIGRPQPTPSIDYMRIADDLSQDRHVPGLPFGTRGGTLVRYNFPMDATYEIRVRLARDLNESLPLYTEAQELEISVDGARAGSFTLPGVTSPAAGAAPAGGRGAAPAGGRGAAPAGRGAAPPAQATPDAGRGAAPPAAPTPDAGQGADPTPQAAAPAAAPAAAAPGAPAGQPAPPARAPISQIAQGVRVSAREREARNRADESWNLRVPLKAGQREIAIAFVNRTAALEETTRLPFLRPYPAGVNIPETRQGAHIRSVEIAGPYDASGPGDSPSRRRIFTCSPDAAPGASPASASSANSARTAQREATCATSILTTLTRRAYRRPVVAADVEPLLAFYREGREQGGFDAGIERALRRLLVSPEFLFRVERDPAGVAPGVTYRVSDVELASRLSFFLWSSIPDDELLDLASKRQLGTPTALAAQVRRMLADPRAEAFVENFAGQWLFLRNLQATGPVQSVFPDFDDSLRQAFRRETELFFDSIVHEDRSALDLLRADYTFLNERLAKHYGIPNIKGSHFRRVALGKDSMRAGLLGQGSILTVTSYPDRTSPVVRGKWILENLLGTPPPPPPPNVGELQPTNGDGTVLSMRQRMEQHRANPVCASCHAMMDPLGLSLENFDAVGKWRTLGESSAAIDATGSLPDGTKFEGVAGLRQALLSSNRYVATLTEKMLTYSLGRGLEHYDAPAVRAIVRDAAREDYRFSSLLLGVVQSTPFRMRQAAAVRPAPVNPPPAGPSPVSP